MPESRFLTMFICVQPCLLRPHSRLQIRTSSTGLGQTLPSARLKYHEIPVAKMSLRTFISNEMLLPETPVTQEETLLPVAIV
jgi:hypothetical protein